MLYFDHNATSPLCAEARAAWLDATERFIGNPSSPHRVGTRAEAALEDARGRLAAHLGCEPWEVVWTSGATEAANTLVRHYAEVSKGEAWVSAIEHPCVLQAVRRYFPKRHRLIPVLRNGAIDFQRLQEMLRRERPALVGVMAANNETGVLQPWREAAGLCRESGVSFFCDAAQWVGKMPAAGLGLCDAVTGCGHKFGGPQGVGFLKCTARLQPLLVGGGQENGRRAGTENVAGVLSMIAALDWREKQMLDQPLRGREEFRDQFAAELASQIPGLQVVAEESSRLWNTLSVVMPRLDCRQRWVVKLDKFGCAVSTGSACASGREKPSHVLSAMGIAPEVAANVLRVSSGWESTEDDWKSLLEKVCLAVQNAKATTHAQLYDVLTEI